MADPTLSLTPPEPASSETTAAEPPAEATPTAPASPSSTAPGEAALRSAMNEPWPRRRNVPVAPVVSVRARILARVLAVVVPWLLLALVAAPFALYYRLTILSGATPFHFARPAFLALLVVVPLLGVWLFHLAPRFAAAIVYSRTRDLRLTRQGATHHLARLPSVMRLCALALCALALARPQQLSSDLIELEGIDIVIALDVSNSMSDADMQPDRLTVAKRVLQSFIEHRKSDRIGLVIFGRDAFTQCPLTLDYHALAGLLDSVRLGLVNGQGTAIGNALGTALNRLRKSDARSKVIILLTDGDNNAGNIAPAQAAKFAQSMGVKIFTVLIGRDVDAGSQGNLFQRAAPRYPVNPKLLEEIAGTTGGTPYLATDTVALEKRFQAILDELDRSRVRDQKGKPRELFLYFAMPMLGLLLLEIALSLTRFRRWP